MSKYSVTSFWAALLLLFASHQAIAEQADLAGAVQDISKALELDAEQTEKLATTVNAHTGRLQCRIQQQLQTWRDNKILREPNLPEHFCRRLSLPVPKASSETTATVQESKRLSHGADGCDSTEPIRTSIAA